MGRVIKSKIVAMLTLSLMISFSLAACGGPGGGDSDVGGAASLQGEGAANVEDGTLVSYEEIGFPTAEVVESGFTVMDDGSLEIAFVVEQGAGSCVARGLPVLINIEGSNGSGEAAISLNAVYPGERYAYSLMLDSVQSRDEGGETSFVDVSELLPIHSIEMVPMPSSAEWYKTSVDGSLIKKAFSLGESKSDINGSTTTITVPISIDKTYADTLKSESTGISGMDAYVVAIFKDVDGSVIYGSPMQLAYVMEGDGEETEVSIHTEEMVLSVMEIPADRQWMSYELYVMPTA